MLSFRPKKYISYLLIAFSFTFISVQLSGQRIRIIFNKSLDTIPNFTHSKLRFDKDFAYSLTLDDGTADAFTHALPVLNGGSILNDPTIYKALTFTDGCGNQQTFKAGLAWYSVNGLGQDIHDGNLNWILNWSQLDSLYSLGWDCFNHSYSHRSKWDGPMTNNDYIDQIIRNRNFIISKTKNKIATPIFVVPSGDATYEDIALNQGQLAVFNQGGNTVGFPAVEISDNSILRPIIFRHDMNTTHNASINWLDTIVNKSLNSTKKYWYNEFVHIINTPTSNNFDFSSFRSRMNMLERKWGKSGNDRMWMAPLQEVFEYSELRNKTTLKITKENPVNLLVSFTINPSTTNFRNKCISLVCNSSNNISDIIVPPGVKVSFSGNKYKKLINLDFTNYKGGDIPNLPATSSIEPLPALFKILENPIQSYLTLQYNPREELPHDSNLIEIIIYDIEGKIFKKHKILPERDAQINIPFENSAPGNYLVNFYKNGKMISSGIKITKL
jgi:hypothetical protein